MAGHALRFLSQTVTTTVRLVSGNNNCSGRVELFAAGYWGTVLVCRQAGCGDAVAVTRYAQFGQGSGLIWMDNVHCSGNETSLFECSHNGLGGHYCSHYEDSGVICEVRLVSGINNCSGTVEVFAAGHWGTVCHNSWDINEATVVCRQAGCGNAVAVTHWAQFGQGSGIIWMDNVRCSGNETSVFECSHNGLGAHYCGHYQDAGVICEGMSFTHRPLVSGINNCSGTVEVFAAGYWGTVCDNSWDINDATVVCRQAGCGDAVAVARYAQFGQGSGFIWMDNIHCSGNETSVFECSHNGLGDHYCGHYQDAGVICEVRLVSGINNCSGTVEVFVGGYWGTVCHNSWDINDATVVCRQAGCGDAVAVTHNAQFGEGIGFIWMDNVHCSGNETSVFECSHNGLGAHYCGHYQDAGVICEGMFLLVSGNNNCSGTVEVFVGGYWGTVCHNSWDINDATVVCRQAGCGDAVAVARSAQFGHGSGFIWMDNVHCSGNETSVFQCSHNGLGDHYCGHYQDAGVICEGMFL
uniref:SRCR domain-containing protein n=1 Tax=Neogobius melanostomus TaxID=47308 RepID=A0A8C6SCK0_9GOBI